MDSKRIADTRFAVLNNVKADYVRTAMLIDASCCGEVDEVVAGSVVKVSVIVPHYQDLEALDRCLAALERQTYPRDQFEVVVADNASAVGEAEVARVIAGRARLMVVHERGAGPARNGGVEASRGEILAFTDSDCVPEPQWLSEGVAALERSDIVGGQVTVLVADPAAPTPAEAFETVFAFNFKDYILRKGFTGSGNLFVPRRIFDEVGGFAVGVSEDVEWSMRARGKGFRIGYAEQAVVAHPARRSWEELKAKWLRVNSETYGLLTQRSAGRVRWLARTWATPLSAVAHTPKVLRDGRLDARGKLKALNMLYKLRLWRFVDGHRVLFGLRR
jgi:GT2 family glycosyltransferase